MPSLQASGLLEPVGHNNELYQQHAARMVDEVMSQLAHEMRGQPASMVREMVREIMDMTLQHRLPGIPVDDETKRDVAARIAIGVWLG